MSESGASYASDAPEGAALRVVAAGNGAGAVAQLGRPSALVGVAIPSRDRTVRRMVVDLYTRCPHLTAADIYAAARACHLYRKIERLGRDLEDRGLFRADGDPRKAIGEWRQLMAEARAHEAALGITAAARAAMGVDIAKGQGFAERVQRAREGR